MSGKKKDIDLGDFLDEAITTETSANPTETQGERIAKHMSRAGVCSRRDAEALIAQGRVTLNGETVETPAIKVTEKDDIRLDGETIRKPEKARVWLLYKPSGYITTNKDPEGRQTIFDLLPKNMPRVMTIGRLDLNSEGLLILTNDGGVARHMELPATGWTRRYRVRVNGTPNTESLRKLKKGMKVDDIHYGSVSAVIDKEQGSNCWLTVSLTEGKKREIRVLFEALGHPVSRLIRVSYGPFQLGDMEKGSVKEVPTSVLKNQLGKKFFK